MKNHERRNAGGVVDLFLESRDLTDVCDTTMTMTTAATTTGRVVFKLIKKLLRRMKNPTTYKTSLSTTCSPPSDATLVAIAVAVALVRSFLRKKGKKSMESTPFRYAFIYLDDELDCFSIYLDYLFHDLTLEYFPRKYKQANCK